MRKPRPYRPKPKKEVPPQDACAVAFEVYFAKEDYPGGWNTRTRKGQLEKTFRWGWENRAVIFPRKGGLRVE